MRLSGLQMIENVNLGGNIFRAEAEGLASLLAAPDNSALCTTSCQDGKLKSLHMCRMRKQA